MLGSSSTPLIAAGGNNPGTALAIIGHAGGRALSLSSLSAPIQTSVSTSKLIDFGPKGTTSEPVYLHYTTPTEAGNSGSPVIELENGTVVAVHHMVFSPDGLPRLGGKSGVNIASEGVSIHSIRKAIDASLSSINSYKQCVSEEERPLRLVAALPALPAGLVCRSPWLGRGAAPPHEYRLCANQADVAMALAFFEPMSLGGPSRRRPHGRSLVIPTVVKILATVSVFVIRFCKSTR